jgi:hypothetical protein
MAFSGAKARRPLRPAEGGLNQKTVELPVIVEPHEFSLFHRPVEIDNCIQQAAMESLSPLCHML